MTLKKTAQEVIEMISTEDLSKWSSRHDKVVFGALRAAINAEQAQAVEPVGVVTFLPGGVRPILSRLPGARLNAGDKLFTHPAPPATTVSETLAAQGIKLRGFFEEKPRGPVPAVEPRAKVGNSRFESWYSDLHQAGKGSKQIAREAYEAGLNEAQQVAVPQVQMTDDDLEKMWLASKFDVAFLDFEDVARAIEAHHGIKGAKP